MDIQKSQKIHAKILRVPSLMASVSPPPAVWTPLLRPRTPPHGPGAGPAAPAAPGTPPPGRDQWTDTLW